MVISFLYNIEFFNLQQLQSVTSNCYVCMCVFTFIGVTVVIENPPLFSNYSYISMCYYLSTFSVANSTTVDPKLFKVFYSILSTTKLLFYVHTSALDNISHFYG